MNPICDSGMARGEKVLLTGASGRWVQTFSIVWCKTAKMFEFFCVPAATTARSMDFRSIASTAISAIRARWTKAVKDASASITRRPRYRRFTATPRTSAKSTTATSSARGTCWQRRYSAWRVASGRHRKLQCDWLRPRQSDAPANEDMRLYPFERTMPYEVSKTFVELESLAAVSRGLDVSIATSCAILGPHDYKAVTDGAGAV